MRYNNKTIYIPFDFINRFMDINLKEREEKIDYCIVHELSHALWDNIAKNEGIEGFLNKDKRRTHKFSREWCEGFATYCSDEYFAEFFPLNASTPQKLRRVYGVGKRKVEELVKKHGKEILLEIPKRWKEFSREVA